MLSAARYSSFFKSEIASFQMKLRLFEVRNELAPCQN
jgi:hypothetical protein